MNQKYFKVRPKENYKLLGTNAVLNKNLVYLAIDATNQPNWKTGGLIFVQFIPGGFPATDGDMGERAVDGFLLKSGEYIKV